MTRRPAGSPRGVETVVVAAGLLVASGAACERSNDDPRAASGERPTPSEDEPADSAPGDPTKSPGETDSQEAGEEAEESEVAKPPDDAELHREIALDGERRLEVYRRPGESEELCDPADDRIIRLVEDDRLLDEEVFEARCEGACTEEEVREGEEELERRDERGERHVTAPPTLTRCFGLGHQIRKHFDGSDRPVLLVTFEVMGKTREEQARLVTAGCDRVVVSEAFSNPHWPVIAGGDRFAESRLRAPDEPKSANEADTWVLELADTGEQTEEHAPTRAAFDVTFDRNRCRWALDEVPSSP